MLNVVGIDEQVSANYRDSFNEAGAMGKDDFLHLLVTQLKHQDPLNPMENTQFAAQLAHFSSLETLHSINDSIQSSLLLNQSLNNSFMTSIIGKDIKAYGNGVAYEGKAVDLEFELPRDADVRISILDKNGNTVRTIDAGTMRAGDRQISWDGIKNDGTKAEEGLYSFEISATDASGQRVTAHPISHGFVSGIAYHQGSPFLIVNGQYVNLGDIISIHTPSGSDNETRNTSNG